MEGLGINPQLLVVFVVNFLLLLILLSVFLYKPVLKTLDERQAKIKESLDQAEQVKQQTAEAEQSIKAQLDSARKEGQKIIAQSEQIAERLKTEAVDEARKEAESLIAKAHTESQRQREKDLDELRRQFADIAMLAAEKVIKESLDKEKHRKVISEVLDESSTLQ